MQSTIKTLQINEEYAAPLSRSIVAEFNALTDVFAKISITHWQTKNINYGKHLQSPQEIIAYQIGWGKLLLSWYNAGIKGILPVMPGEGFTTWNYRKLAEHFHTKYAFTDPNKQYQEFRQTVAQILHMCETEYHSGNLDKIEVWSWCTLKSGKEWPLSKWIQVNTVAPYKRARNALRTSQNLLKD